MVVSIDRLREEITRRALGVVEPDPPIDDSTNGKLDRLLKIVGEHSDTLAVLRKFVGHYGFGTSDDKPFDDGPDRTKEVLHVPGVGELQSTTVKVPAVGDQSFGFDAENLNPEIEADVQRSADTLSVRPDGSGYETRAERRKRKFIPGM
jgi:hypothetical protein